MTSSGDFPGEFQAGDIVGDTYMVLDYIGRGAMGHLYHARHTILNTEYALKILSSEKVTELDWKRFQNEAQATAGMNHPNVVSIYNFGLHQGILPFYVMDLLKGLDLGQKVRADGPLEIKEAVAVFLEVCSGIGYAHKKGIIHRDIKPGNIFLLDRADPTGAKVKVVDFGIAKLTVTKKQETQALTAVGDVVGTPYYMSPEQCMGSRVDARSDIYSLGCTLFEALTGVLPFRARNPTEVMLLHHSEPPPSLNSKASGGKVFPDSLEYIIATTLAKEPSERYQTMDLLAQDLAALIESNRPIVATPGGVTIEKFEAIPAIVVPSIPGIVGISSNPNNPNMQELQNKRQSFLVSVAVAAVLAASCYAYWQSRLRVKMPPQLSWTDQLQKLSSGDLSGKTAGDPIVQRTEFEIQTAALEKAKQIDARNANEPFSTISKIDGKSMRCFDFPDQPVIGKIRDWYKTDFIKAAGEVIVPEESYLTFCPTEAVGRDPGCLKRFRRHEIYCVQFSPGADSDEMLMAALNIPDLQELDFTNSRRLAEPPVSILKQFHHLEWFVGSRSETDGAALAQAKCWGNMHALFLPKAKNILPLLKELQTSQQLARLGLGPSHLTEQEYRAIASMSKLWLLDLSGNPVTNKDLKILSKLHDMSTLSLINTDVDISALETIKQFEKLTILNISSGNLSPADFKMIQQALPKVKVTRAREPFR